MAFPAGMPIDEEIVMGVGKSARNRIDSMIRKGVMPNIAGQPTLDAATGMAKGVKKPVVAAPKTSFMKSAGGGAVLASVPSMVMQGIQAFNKNIPDEAVAHPLDFIGTGIGQAAARLTLPKSTLDAADAANVSAYQGTRFDPNAAPPADKPIIKEAAAPASAAMAERLLPAPAASMKSIASDIPNPSTPEQQQNLRTMGITQDRIINHGAGVDMATANKIERQGKYGGKDGMFTQLAGYGDQNSVYGRASKAGGKINEFYGTGTGKASSPGSIAGNVVPSQAITAPPSGEGMAAALKAVADRGDWGAVERHYAQQGQGFGGKTAEQIMGTDAQSQLAGIMAMPTNTFSDLAAKRAALATFRAGSQDRESTERNAILRNRNIADMATMGVDLEAKRQGIESEKLDMAGKRSIASLRDALLNAKTPQEQASVANKITVLSGNLPKAANPVALNVEEPVMLKDPKTGEMFASDQMRKSQRLVDPSTGRVIYDTAAQPQASQQDEYASFKAAWDANKDPAARKRLEAHARSMGLIK